MTSIPNASAPVVGNTPVPIPFKFLSTATGSSWVSLDAPTGDVDEEKLEHENTRQRFSRQLSDVLLAENLVILTGLGTSLCLRDEHGNSLAPDMKALWEAAKAKAGDKFNAIKTKVNYPGTTENIEFLLSRCLLFEKLNPDPDIQKFVTETEAIIVDKCRFIKSGLPLVAHEAFLRKVARRSTRLPRTKIFTTNYDLCFETAASKSRFVVIDGFSHSEPQEFDGSYFNYDLVRRNADREAPDYISNVFHLYKLHGSLDWQKDGTQIFKARTPKSPLIVYPRESKFESSYDQPFIEMMAALQSALRQPNTGLLVVGFGFNDHHISQPIASAIRANVSLRAMVVSPGLDGTTRLPLKEITDLITAGDSRLSLLETTFERLVEVIPDLIAPTDDEAHRGRIRKVEGRS